MRVQKHTFLQELKAVSKDALVAHERKSTRDLPIVILVCLATMRFLRRDFGPEGNAGAHDGTLLDDARIRDDTDNASEFRT